MLKTKRFDFAAFDESHRQFFSYRHDELVRHSGGPVA